MLLLTRVILLTSRTTVSSTTVSSAYKHLECVHTSLLVLEM